ncbi:hypothetical protein Tco_1197908, partial [Tanacetum coccineum]
KGKLEPRYVGPFEIVERLGPVAYRLRLPQELSDIHDAFHVSNLKKCLADTSLQVPLEEIKINDKLHFMEEPIEVVDREMKKLKQRRIKLVKVHWNSKRGAEFTSDLLESSRTKDHLQDYQGCHQVEDDSSSMYTSDSDAELEVKGLKTMQKQELSGSIWSSLIITQAKMKLRKVSEHTSEKSARIRVQRKARNSLRTIEAVIHTRGAFSTEDLTFCRIVIRGKAIPSQ